MTEEPQGLSRLYLTAWLVLIAITALEMSTVLVFHISAGSRVVILILLALMKASLIGAYYMGLRFERLAMAYIAILPLILLFLMLLAVVPDAALLLPRH
jgi:cytochrome c oxidase subunit IV